MDSSNIYRFNGVDPFDNWTILDAELYGFYPRNSLINMISKAHGPVIKDEVMSISEGVTSIKGSCFRKNRSIKGVEIPKSVKYISEVAFLESNIILYVYKNSCSEKFAQRKGLKYQYI